MHKKYKFCVCVNIFSTIFSRRQKRSRTHDHEFTDEERFCIALRDFQVCMMFIIFNSNLIIHYSSFCFCSLQWQTNCSTKTLQHLLWCLRDGELGRLVRIQCKMPKSVADCDAKSRKMVRVVARTLSCLILFVLFSQAGVASVEIHGCTSCENIFEDEVYTYHAQLIPPSPPHF